MLLLALIAGQGNLLLVRFVLGARFLARQVRAECFAVVEAPAPAVTVLQPILSGDPMLQACLAANLQAHPDAAFVWLLDEDDAEAQACAARAAAGAANVAFQLGPPPRRGENPKSAKLARALPQVRTPFTAVLDDDTVLPPGGLWRAVAGLRAGGIACGLPIYAARANVWSRLVGGFVNGASLITYPAAAELGAGRTLNGMFYVTRTEELRALGGFDAIAGELTDDYALAKLYLAAGRPLVQTAVVHPVVTTVVDARHYTGLMRRWMVFANRYVAENRGPFTLGLVGVSTLAPLALLVAALLRRDARALSVLAVILAFKAAGNAWLRRRYAGAPTSFTDAAAEVAADLLTPLHLAAACVRPVRLIWRSRTLRLERGAIVYE